MVLTKRQVDEVEERTRGQRENHLWHEVRRCRITASNFGRVISAHNNNHNYSESLKTSLNGHYNIENIPSVRWGVENEVTAVSAFESKTGLQVRQCGIFLHKSGRLCASPDGLVGHDAIVEIKCPYSLRNSRQLPAYIDKRSGNLSKKHQYYAQVQGTMYITGRKICYFVVWTPLYTHITMVKYQQRWARDNIPKLLHAHEAIFSACI